jgi:hypothetical protein
LSTVCHPAAKRHRRETNAQKEQERKAALRSARSPDHEVVRDEELVAAVNADPLLKKELLQMARDAGDKITVGDLTTKECSFFLTQAEHDEAPQHRRSELDKMMWGESGAHRHNRTGLRQYARRIAACMRAAIMKAASRRVGAQAVIPHSAGIITRYSDTDRPAQPWHVDVVEGAMQFHCFLEDAVPTEVIDRMEDANPSVDEFCSMAGVALSLHMDSAVRSMVGARHLCREPDMLRPVFCGGREKVEAGEMTAMVGGLPHRGPALKAKEERAVIFAVGTPLHCADVYDYDQIHVCEPELFLACITEEAHVRARLLHVAKDRATVWMELWNESKMDGKGCAAARVWKEHHLFEHFDGLRKQAQDRVEKEHKEAMEKTRAAGPPKKKVKVVPSLFLASEEARCELRHAKRRYDEARGVLDDWFQAANAIRHQKGYSKWGAPW